MPWTGPCHRSAALACLIAALLAGATRPALAAEVRVGVVAFQDFAGDWERYQGLFADLSLASGGALRFRLAAGTYGDVLHWLRQAQVDVAILSPGVAAASLCDDPESGAAAPCLYLATKCLKPASASLAPAAERTPGYRDGYRALCVVPAGSAIQGLADLRQAILLGHVQLLFVHPLSVSGHLAPLYALSQCLAPDELRLALAQSVFTSSHTNSVRLLRELVPGKTRVAFLFDDALAADPEAESALRRVALPPLDDLRVPADAVVARRTYAGAERLSELLLQHVDATGVRDFVRFPDGPAVYGPVQAWARAGAAAGSDSDTQRVSLDEIGWLLVHDARSQRRPPRLALVLSGGGAKCAYQLGVVRALEEKLADLRRMDPQSGLDIALVVGTSGGAMNALPVAMGITATPQGRESFRDLWAAMDQRDLVRLPWLVRANLGLWFACIQLAVMGRLLRRRVPDPARRYRMGAVVIVVLALPVLLLHFLPCSPWRLLGPNHVLHHIWLYGSFGMRFAAWCLLALGGTGLAIDAWRRRRRGSAGAPRQARGLGQPRLCGGVETASPSRARPVPGWLARLPVLGILLLPLAQAVTMLLGEPSLATGQGIEHALGRQLTALIGGHLQRQGLPPLDLHGTGSDADRLRAASRQILQRGLLKRDLVLTGSCLGRAAAGGLPSDLYFHAAATPASPTPDYGPRGVSLQDWPDLLLDVTMGSGAIFPLFPARALDDFPRPGERVELIDGGFAHNSPIEAAVLWGATHIILVDPSPERPIEIGNLAGNVLAAFRHLHLQAQLIDVRNQGKVGVFSLRPGPDQRMCVLDFAGNLIEDAVARGYDDARGAVRVGDLEWLGRPRFRKEPGEPSNWLAVPAEGP